MPPVSIPFIPGLNRFGGATGGRNDPPPQAVLRGIRFQ